MKEPNLIRRNTLGDVLRRTARRVPKKTAVVCGTTEWTYAEYDALVTQSAAGMAARGIRSGVKVAVLSRNSHSLVALRFALARLGAVLVPINFMLLPPEVAYILTHSGATWLCVDSEFGPLGAAAAKLGGQVREIIWLPGEYPSSQPAGTISFEGLRHAEGDFVEGDVDGQSIAQIMYTSGTESTPKGVLLTHQAILTQYVACAVELEVAENDRILHSLPMYHCAQLDTWFGPSVLVGGYNFIVRAPEPERILQLIGRHRISSYFAPPTVWISLLRSPLFDQVDLSCLEKGYYGASIMPTEVLRELLRRLPRLRLWNGYGQTEMAPLATALKPGDQLRKAGSAGRPTINVETRVVRDDMSDVEVGEIGEIVHRSPQLFMGYLNDPEKTAAAFTGDWFHSGDLGILDDEGYLTVVDRKKDMIKTGGENVSSCEVEEVIYRLDGVSEVAVVGLADPRWIEAVTAIVVPKAGANLSEAEVITHCAQFLGHYKRPKHVFFTESLPKNASGKIMKRELRLRYSEEKR